MSAITHKDKVMQPFYCLTRIYGESSKYIAVIIWWDCGNAKVFLHNSSIISLSGSQAMLKTFPQAYSLVPYPFRLVLWEELVQENHLWLLEFSGSWKQQKDRSTSMESILQRSGFTI